MFLCSKYLYTQSSAHFNYIQSLTPDPPTQPEARMCQATACYCTDCKQEYWTINENACWRAHVSNLNEAICWNITFLEILELKEWMDCAKCRGDSEGRNLKFTKPPGLRLNVHRVHNKDRKGPLHLSWHNCES